MPQILTMPTKATDMTVGREQVPDGLTSLIDRLNGAVTYRQLDYWLRCRWIWLEHKMPPPRHGYMRGCGYERKITPAEEQSIIDVIGELQAINERLKAVKSGEFYAHRLEQNKAHP